jgi:hypothetical protein
MKDEAGFSILVDATSAPLCMTAEGSMCGAPRVKVAESARGLVNSFADYEREYMPRFPVRPDWQQRIIDECQELNDRLGKLCDYMATDAYRALDEISRHLLGKQLGYMRDYAHILGMRIARFG